MIPTVADAPRLKAPRFNPQADDAADWPARPETVRVMVVAPGPLFSTKDVWDGAVAGLQALGCQVLPLDYHTDLQMLQDVACFKDLRDDHVFHHYKLYASHRAVVRAMAFRPHLILSISGTLFPAPAAGLLSQYTRTAVWLTESPYQEAQEVYIHQFYRTVFTNERLSVEQFKEIRREIDHHYPDEVYYLPHGYDPARHFPREVGPDYHSDVCFIGSPFPERQELLGGVNWDGIDFRAFGVFAEAGDEAAMAGPNGAVPNAEAQRWYAGAKINLNHHRTVRYYGSDVNIARGEAESLNPRVYELAAAGCFQICDDSRPELVELFGDSIPTYRAGDSADLERVIRYWLARPRERAAKAAEARARVQAHSVTERMRQVLDTCLRKDV